MDLSLVGSVVDGKYRVEGLLGRGGMGAVFRAVHLGTDRTVALKVIVPDHAARADFLARFEREARACGRLRHPNIVDVTDFGYADVNGGRLAYLVMEFLDGCSLADVLRDAKALPIAWVVDVLGQVGSALEEAHRAGILHRDLKPDNIWLEPNRRGGYTIKVLDFGLAKLGQAAEPAPSEPSGPVAELSEEPTSLRPAPVAAAAAVEADDTEQATRVRPSPTPAARTSGEAGATEMGAIMGTPAYMSPEQCRGLPLSPRSDVYSLAVIAYRLLAGELPFSGSAEELLTAQMTATPRPIRQLRKDLPKTAAELVMLGLSKTPEQRPPSAGAFTEMLAARSQSTADFFKEALLLFFEHGRAFLSASLLGLSPVLLLGLFAAVNAIAYVYGYVIVPAGGGPSVVIAAIMMTVGPGMLLVQGAVIPATMQAVVAPLQPIDVGTLRRRFRPRSRGYLSAVTPILAMFVATGLWQFPVGGIRKALQPLIRGDDAGLALLGVALLSVLPNVPIFVMIAVLAARSGSLRGWHFLGAVAVVEGLPAREALARSTQLAKGPGQRANRILMIAVAVGGSIVGAFSWGLLARRMPPQVALGTLAILFALAFVVVAPFLAVVNALTYLRARRILGEPLDIALADFERAVLPESHWKLAERERVATLIASRR